MTNKNYNDCTDEELISRLRQGDDDAADFLCVKYKPLVRKISQPLFLIGGEPEDLIQEGMLGLFKATKSYEPDHGADFFHFAAMCIERQMLKAIEASSRNKNQPLNGYVSLSDTEGEAFELPSFEAGPEEEVILHEDLKERLNEVKKNLSPLEKKVFDLFIAGDDYREIAKKLEKTEKAVDNALTRIKLKAQNKA